MEKYEVIMNACQALSDSQDEECLRLIIDNYRYDPMDRPEAVSHTKTPVADTLKAEYKGWNENPLMKMKVFARDGFVNRFSGELLVLPAVLRILSQRWPEDFPFHQNWKLGKIHLAYYQLGACANKKRTPSMGGGEEEDNLLTTTMPFVMARGNATIEDIGWKVYSPGDVNEWDGMSTWYIEYLDDKPALRKHYFFNKWYNAAKKVLRK